MRAAVAILLSVFVAAPVFAQKSMSTNNPNAVQIQGNTNIEASNKNVTAIAVGENNTAKNTTGAIKGGTQIQGNTTIKAQQKNATAIAVGKGNTAANEAGVIGGK